ncbi:MAG TPA: GtrA family protein [Xanthomonadaceae bacterium]|jgi:putative flippase GtrA
MLRSQFARFVLVGGLAALANVLSRVAFNFAMPYVPSIVLAYLVGMATAFALNRRFVFAGATRPLHGQVLWFTAVNIAALLQTLAVSLFLSRIALPKLGWTVQPETIAHLVGVVVPVFTSYLGHRHLTFSRSDRSA